MAAERRRARRRVSRLRHRESARELHLEMRGKRGERRRRRFVRRGSVLGSRNGASAEGGPPSLVAARSLRGGVGLRGGARVPRGVRSSPAAAAACACAYMAICAAAALIASWFTLVQPPACIACAACTARNGFAIMLPNIDPKSAGAFAATPSATPSPLEPAPMPLVAREN